MDVNSKHLSDYITHMHDTYIYIFVYVYIYMCNIIIYIYIRNVLKGIT